MLSALDVNFEHIALTKQCGILTNERVESCRRDLYLLRDTDVRILELMMTEGKE
jgi:hypothetical protein